jgi:hypothetical protein
MNAQEIVLATIDSAIRECDTHVRRLERSVSLLESFFPLTEKALKELSEERIEHIDQFIYRFTRLQDSMGSRLLPALYSWLEDSREPVPQIDRLNRLEQLGVLESVERWRFFRNLRNSLAHDYPESIGQTVRTLNTLFREFTAMVRIYTVARDYFLKRAA